VEGVRARQAGLFTIKGEIEHGLAGSVLPFTPAGWPVASLASPSNTKLDGKVAKKQFFDVVG
jgi:hypothetical protein